MADDSWRTASYRQIVVTKIDEAICQSQMSMPRSSMEMENHIYQKSRTKEEYLGFVALLILHVREIKTKKINAMNAPGAVQGGPGMPGPINALQNLASQALCNTQMSMPGPQVPSQLQNQLNNQMQRQVPLGNQVPNQLQNQLGGDMQCGISGAAGAAQIPSLQNQISNQLTDQILEQLQQMQLKPTDN